LVETFLEAVACPAVSPEAVKTLATKPRLRVVEVEGDADVAPWSPRVVAGGMLVQTLDDAADDEARWKVPTRRQPTAVEMEGLGFAWAVARFVRSNAVVLAQASADGCRTTGIGPGQTSRVEAVRSAIRRAGPEAQGSVLASDGFFPHPDGVEEAAAAGVSALIQPGGSKKDEEVLERADRAGLAMVMTGVRHFRH
jgi:phosphoribosylaminoimidazolecarboxamide formyltransferase/IMP cyclohydrolase